MCHVVVFVGVFVDVFVDVVVGVNVAVDVAVDVVVVVYYVCCVLCCAIFVVKYEEMNTYGQNRLKKWSKSREKMQKHTQETLGTDQNTVSFFGTVWPPTDPKKVQKRTFFPTHCFYTSPGIYRRFRSKVLSQTPKKSLFPTRS